MNREKNEFINEGKYPLKRKITNVLCLVLPIAMSFAGYFTAEKVCGTKFLPEHEKTHIVLGATVISFLVPVFIIFIRTRDRVSFLKLRLPQKTREQADSAS